MTRNTLNDLSLHLFEQLERLNDDELSSEALQEEIKRSEAMEKISNRIIQVAEVSLKAMKTYDERRDLELKMPKMLEG